MNIISVLYLFFAFILIGEAIEKMLQEKKISSKINYEVLKSLNVSLTTLNKEQQKIDEPVESPRVNIDNAAGSSKVLVLRFI